MLALRTFQHTAVLIVQNHIEYRMHPGTLTGYESPFAPPSLACRGNEDENESAIVQQQQRCTYLFPFARTPYQLHYYYAPQEVPTRLS